jgi:hypothetical protein
MKLVSHIEKQKKIKHLLKINENKNDNYNLRGVYQLQCADCPLKYMGQTGRTFKIRFREHIIGIKNNGLNSIFAQHVLDTTHKYCTMDKTMKILYILVFYIYMKDFILMKSTNKIYI